MRLTFTLSRTMSEGQTPVVLVVDVVEVVEDTAHLRHQSPHPGSVVVVVVLCVHPVSVFTPDSQVEGANDETEAEPKGGEIKDVVVRDAVVEDEEDVGDAKEAANVIPMVTKDDDKGAQLDPMGELVVDRV